MKRIGIKSIVAMILILTAFVAFRTEARVWRGWSGQRWHHPGPVSYLAHQLNLSHPQEAQIRTLWQIERPAISAHIHELLAENREMNALAARENPGQSKVEEIANREAATIAALLVEKEQLQSKIYTTVLNPEQRTKADELKKNWELRLDHAASRIGTQPAEK
jgi:Spy/CpxP family protein refolding chaperone